MKKPRMTARIKGKEAKAGAPYRYIGSGLDNVYLANGFTLRDTPYGKAVAIDNMDGLHKAIAMFLVNSKPELTGKELRFLRIEMDMPQKEIGDLMGVSDQTIALWEKGRVKIPGYGNILIRVIYKEFVGVIADMIRTVKHLNALGKMKESKIVFKETQHGWCQKKAA